MKTLKLLKEEQLKYYLEHPEYFKLPYSKKMGGTQTVVIEGVGEFNYDDRQYYTGRAKKYNSTSMHHEIGKVVISQAQIQSMAAGRAKILYNSQKSKMEAVRKKRKAYNEAVALVGKEKLDAGISLVKKFIDKTYYFIGNVMLYKAYKSDCVVIEIVSDERRKEFVWKDWYSAPYAPELGMTPEDKNLFIC